MEDWGFSLHFVFGFQYNSIYTLHFMFWLRYYKMVQSLYKKLTPGLKNHMRNLDNFREAVDSHKSWNLMGYFCPKNTFLQLKHYLPKIYLTLLSTTCVKFIKLLMSFLKPYISHFSRHSSSVFFLAQTLHTFYKSSPSKCKFSDFPLLRLKFTKFFMSFFK